MRTSDSEEQFLTSLKNGKIGVFRIQTLRTQIEQLLESKVVFERTDYNSVIVGNIEMIFDNSSNLLESICIKFSFYENSQPWHKLLRLIWLDWLSKSTLELLMNLLVLHKLSLKKIKYIDESSSIVVRVLPATVEIYFDKSGDIDSLRLNFSNPYQILSAIKTMTTH